VWILADGALALSSARYSTLGRMSTGPRRCARLSVLVLTVT
jgi:hypothetical protein